MPSERRTRMGIGALALSAIGLVTIAMREGYSDEAIIPTKGDVPTYGFGVTTRPDGSPVRMGDRTTPQRALADAATKLDTIYEAAVKRCVKVPLYQAEYDVYVSMAYNIGTGAFCSSSIAQRANAQDYRAACEAILMWRMYQGQDCSKPNRVCAGLWKDRQRDHARCMAAQ